MTTIERQSPRPRRFGLLDAMVLTASIAVGFAAFRGQPRPGGFWEDHHSRGYFYAVVVTFASDNFLLALTLGWLLIRLRRPRPRIRRLLRQPGAVACSTAVLIHAIQVAYFMPLNWGYHSDRFPFAKFMSLAFGPVNPEITGRVILLAWCFLVLAGQSRPEPGAIDRIGRAIGVGWIACGFSMDYIGFTM